MTRTRTILAGWSAFALALAFLLAPADVAAKTWSSDEQNVIVTIPDGAKGWDWLPFKSAWSKYGIVKGAQRTLEKLKNDQPGDGHGALMHLAVRKAEDGMTVAKLAEDDEVRDFLLARFRGTEEDVETEETTMGADGEFEHPALVMRAKGKALNLKGKEAACEGILVATVARGKLVLMRLYAWPTEYDEEGVAVDINFMESDALRLITAKEDGSKKSPEATPPPKDEPEDPTPHEEAGKEEHLEFRAQGWQMTKHAKVKRQEITPEEEAEFLVFKAYDSDRMGSYNFYIYAPPNTQYIDGVKAPPPDLRKWIGPSWWQNFDNNHPKGELATWKWPRKPQTKGARTFLTLPYLEDEENRIVVFEADDKRPAEVDYSDMVKKLKFVDDVKRNNIGRKGKASEAVRGAMSGKRPTGFPEPETVFRFAFRHRDHSYRVFVTFAGLAYKKWGEAVRLTLESIEFGVKFRD